MLEGGCLPLLISQRTARLSSPSAVYTGCKGLKYTGFTVLLVRLLFGGGCSADAGIQVANLDSQKLSPEKLSAAPWIHFGPGTSRLVWEQATGPLKTLLWLATAPRKFEDIRFIQIKFSFYCISVNTLVGICFTICSKTWHGICLCLNLPEKSRGLHEKGTSHLPQRGVPYFCRIQSNARWAIKLAEIGPSWELSQTISSQGLGVLHPLLIHVQAVPWEVEHGANFLGQFIAKHGFTTPFLYSCFERKENFSFFLLCSSF